MTEATRRQVRDPASPRSQLPLVVFDGDDTLWMTERLYDEARDAAARIVEGSGLDPHRWEALELEIDVRNVATMGLSAERFPASCVAAYEELCRQTGVAADPRVVEDVRATASTVFTAKAVVVPGAEDVLRSLRVRNRLALLTQGDETVQRKRIDDSGLAPLFDAVVIVPAKSADTLRALLTELDADADTSWFVGNSIPSDINPAVSCGMHAIWIDAHVWDHERRETPFEHDRIIALPNLSLVPKSIDL